MKNTNTKTNVDCVTFVQERWNQVVQELHEIEGREQPTWLEHAPHWLILVVHVITIYVCCTRTLLYQTWPEMLFLRFFLGGGEGFFASYGTGVVRLCKNILSGAMSSLFTG